MTPRLLEIKARVEAATEGPWAGIDFLADTEVTGKLAIHLGESPLDSSPELFGIFHTAELGPNEQKFISRARADVPYLLKVIELQAREIEALRNGLSEVQTLLDDNVVPVMTLPAALQKADAVAREREALE